MTDPAALPYRPNVGAALFNRAGKVLVARRADLRPDDPHPWQLPQGGVDAGENPERAVLRELREEIGTDAATVIGRIDEWLSYDFPPEVLAKFGKRHPGQQHRGQQHRGQQQLWFALRFLGTDDMIRLDADAHREFSAWRWEELAAIPGLAVPFKRHIYERVARDFAPYANRNGA